MKKIFYICLAIGFMFSSVTFVSCGSDDGGKSNPEKTADRDEAGNIKITEVNFPDPVFRAYLFDKYGADGVLNDAEIDHVIELDLNKKNIQTLKGIEFFRVLEKLSCNNNQLTSLDLSKNTRLTYLSCIYNNQLSSLDVSGCAALTTLECRNNSLALLNVSGCKALNYLYCSNNRIASIDVSECPALTIMSCNWNHLRSLDLSTNLMLTRLSCNNNQLTLLDVSKNTALVSLDCDPEVNVTGWPKY